MSFLPPHARLLYTEQEVEHVIDRLAVKLNISLKNDSPVFVCVLKGALPLTWDLMRRMKIDVSLSFMRVKRFQGTHGGEPRISEFDADEFRNKTVVVVDTVLDEGVTLDLVLDTLRPLAKKVITVVLIKKATRYQRTADLIGLEAPDTFLIGRGMDMDGKYRGLPAIYALEE